MGDFVEVLGEVLHSLVPRTRAPKLLGAVCCGTFHVRREHAALSQSLALKLSELRLLFRRQGLPLGSTPHIVSVVLTPDVLSKEILAVECSTILGDRCWAPASSQSLVSADPNAA